MAGANTHFLSSKSLAPVGSPTTIARWIYLGLRQQREDQSFRELIDTLDRRISSSMRNNPTML